MDHDAIKDLLPLAALVRLEPEEARVLEEHLRTSCDECEAELRELREAAAAMAYSLDPAGSEERLWNRLDARLQASGGRPVVAPASQGGAPAATRTERGRIGLWRAAAGAMAVALVGLAIYVGIISNRLDHVRSDNQRLAELGSEVAGMRTELMNSRGEVRALQAVLVGQSKLQNILLAPDLRITKLEPLKPAPPGAKAIVALSERNNAAIIQASGLPPTPPGKVYELWWITKENGPVEAGLFQASPGNSTTIAPASPPPPGQRVILSAVTLEPAGGVPKPTGAIYLKGAPG